MRVCSEVWDDGNTSNGDGCKTPGSDGETSNILDYEKLFLPYKQILDSELKKSYNHLIYLLNYMITVKPFV